MYEQAGFAYQFPDLHSPLFEAAKVVVDEDDQPLMAAAAERIIQLYLFCGKMEHPGAALHGIRMLHEALRPELKERGYAEANAFLPPQIEKSFGRRLMRSFGWVKNWASYCSRI